MAARKRRIDPDSRRALADLATWTSRLTSKHIGYAELADQFRLTVYDAAHLEFAR